MALYLCGCASQAAPPSPARAGTSGAPSEAAPGAPGLADGPAGVVADFIRERMLRASVDLAAPASVNRGEPAVVVLRVAPSMVPRAVLEQELRTRLERAGYDASAALPVAPRVVATMTAEQDCDIQLRNPPAEREVAFGERTTWEWAVTPSRLSGSSIDLAVTLVAPIVVAGRETRSDVGRYRARVAVQASYRDDLTATLAPLGGVWGLLTAAAAAMVVAGGWMLRARRRRAPRGAAR
jgi:hypothetical protein